MSPLEAFLLALIQGITEFLPISSSAHLILVPYIFGWEEHGLRFEVVTNAGTLLAAIIFFRRDLKRALQQAWSTFWDPSQRNSELLKIGAAPGLLPAVCLASIPVLGTAFFFYDWFATTARQPLIIASTSIFFGLLLWWADRSGSRRRDLSDLRWFDSLVIGVAQAVALIPGTSRSGITMTAAFYRGFNREDAGRFSFILAIPVGVVAFLNDMVEVVSLGGLPQQEWLTLAIGFVVSALSAFVVIDWLLRWLRNQNLTLFVVYRVILGIVIIGFVFLG